MDKVIEAIRANEGTRILQVRDEVLALHQKGKIAIRSRFPIDSIATLRRVYTPGVAEACLEIVKDRALAFDLTSRGNTVAIVTDGSDLFGRHGGPAVLDSELARLEHLAALAVSITRAG